MRRTISLPARMVSGACVAICAARACARAISSSLRVEQLVDEADGQRLVGLDQARRHQHVDGPADAGQHGDAGDVGGRQAVGERARDREAELELARRDAAGRRPPRSRPPRPCTRRGWRRWSAPGSARSWRTSPPCAPRRPSPSAPDLKSRNSEMSVPAPNARPPAPVTMMARTEPSSGTVAQISPSRSYMGKVSALCACGRLKVTMPVVPCTS